MAFIGIDLGTSFLKAAVLNTRNMRPEQVVREPFPEPLPGKPPVFREYDVAGIVRSVSKLLDQLTPLANPCEGILCSTQMHGLVLVDGQGEARSPLLTWLDQRVTLPHPAGQGSYFDVLVARLTPAERGQLGGTELRPGLPVGSLFWMVENGQLPAEDWRPISLADYVVARLCQTTPVTELTNAQAHGALNLQTLDWHLPVIEKLGLSGLRWPEILPQGSVVGHIRLLGRAVPVFTPVGDFQCSAAGALLEPGELWLNISTGSQVSVLADGPALGNFQTRPFFDGRFLATVTTIPAGRALNALVKLLSELAAVEGHPIIDPWRWIIPAAEQATEPRLKAQISFFAGPMGDEGSLVNLREEEMTVGHLFRAAFHNMADNYRQCAERLPVTEPWRKLVFSGGLAQKIDLLRRLICDRFALPYRFSPHSEDALLGLLALGLAFTGQTPSVAAATERVRAAYSSSGAAADVP